MRHVMLTGIHERTISRLEITICTDINMMGRQEAFLSQYQGIYFYGMFMYSGMATSFSKRSRRVGERRMLLN